MCFVIYRFLMLLFITVMFSMCGYFITKYLLDCKRRSTQNYKKTNMCERYCDCDDDDDCEWEFKSPCSFKIHFGD